jgi:hypothetical protein
MMSENLSGITFQGGFLSGFNWSGTAGVAPPLEPEPSSIVPAAIGVMALAAIGLQRRKRGIGGRTKRSR